MVVHQSHKQSNKAPLVCASMCICVCACVCPCVCVHVCMCMYCLCVYMCAHVCMCMLMCVSMYACVCMCMYKVYPPVPWRTLTGAKLYAAGDLLWPATSNQRQGRDTEGPALRPLLALEAHYYSGLPGSQQEALTWEGPGPCTASWESGRGGPLPPLASFHRMRVGDSEM